MIELRTLGALDLRHSDGPEIRRVLTQPKRLALLVYLALARPRGFHQRDALLALFWPDADESHARNGLNKALQHLRRELGAATIVTRGAHELCIDPERLWCDAAACHDALSRRQFAEALEMYRGELLPGFHLPRLGGFEHWLAAQRARLSDAVADAAARLAEDAATRGQLVTAITWMRHAVDLRPANEPAVRRLVELLATSGDRAGAVAEYESLRRRLAREYEVEPSHETIALATSLRSPGHVMRS